MNKTYSPYYQNSKKTSVFIYVLISVILLLPILHYFIAGGTTSYYIDVGIRIGVYLLLALGLNLVIGYTGLLDLGYIGVFGIACYTTAILNTNGVPFILSAFSAIIAVMIFRLLIGLPIIKLRGDYLAIATLGFGEIVRLVANNWDALTNGPRGLPRVGQSIDSINLGFYSLSSSLEVYIFTLIMISLGILTSYRIENSRIGRALIAIREDEIASSLMGINVPKLKLFIFVISGIFGGIAGIIYTHKVGYITPNLIQFWDSILLVSIVVIGGIGSIPGVVFGAIVFYGIPELLRDVLGSQLTEYRMLVFGIITLLMIIFRPQGIIPSERRKVELKPEDTKIREEEDQSMFDIEKR
ncbi:MAG: branched-chain amino acid ABC transporter permease [Brevinematales bacterium]|nr:branched-chain amino acid ABC transporter permease [Brevinematales bacterium]